MASASIKGVSIKKVSDTHFSVEGVLRMHTVMSILNEVASNFNSQKEITIDFAAVKNSDSAAVALIVSWLAKAKARNIKLHLLNLPQQILDIATASDLLEILPIDSH